MSTKRPLLLRDSDLAVGMKTGVNRRMTLSEVRDYYEEARAKDEKLIQTLVDALRNAHKREWGEGGSKPDLFEKEAISLAAAQGFKPSEQ